MVHYWDLIESYEAAVAEASKVFTLPADSVTGAQVAKWLILIDGQVTAALNLGIRLDAVATANYRMASTRQVLTTGVVTDIAGGLLTQANILDNTALGVALAQFTGKVEIQLNKTAGGTYTSVLLQSDMNALQGNGYHQISSGIGPNIATLDTLVSIEVRADASSWLIGTRIELYGLRRVAYGSAP